MKYELQELRRRGAKNSARQYGERTCARCQRPLRKLWNSGAICRGCSHRICSKCRVGVGAVGWKCTVCHAYRYSSAKPPNHQKTEIFVLRPQCKETLHVSVDRLSFFTVTLHLQTLRLWNSVFGFYSGMSMACQFLWCPFKLASKAARHSKNH